MTFEQLNYFSKIVESGSISVAAKNCHISYQAISKSLKNLEEELNTTLLNRHHSGVSLTEYGKAFYKDVQKILQMQENWRNFSKKPNKQHFIVYATYFFTNFIFPTLLPKLENNNYSIQYFPCQNGMIETLLLNSTNKLNTLALTCSFPSQPNPIIFANTHGYKLQPLFTDSFLVYVNKQWFESTFGEGKTSIDAKTLWELPYVRNYGSSSAPLPYGPLYNPDLPHYNIQINESIFPYLQKENLWGIEHASLKDFFEEKYPYIKGISITNSPSILKMEYYILYHGKSKKETELLVHYITDFFSHNYKSNYFINENA